jgi:cytochrome c biogenesis protein CcmG/thiol:disulfide interchange protein DsbE
VLLVVVPAVLIAGYLGVKALRADLATVGVGARAADFAAMTLDSTPRTRTLADYSGSVVLLNIWATWCGPCRVEMPSIQNLHESYAPRGLKVVAVSVDRGGLEDQIRAFADSLGLTFEILHDSAGAIQQAYHTSGIPETVVIGRDGVIRKRVSGAIHWDSPANRALVEQLLAPAG